MNIDSNYHKQSLFTRVFPVFKHATIQDNTVAKGTGAGQEFAYALNIREVLPKYSTEIYFEYARNDNAASFTDFLLEPEEATGYTAGMNRLFKLVKNQFIKVTIELTHLQIPDTFLLRDEPDWYVHAGSSPRDGYTNAGRYVGAGIGPGSNSLMFDISYIRKVNSFGIKFERYVHDNDLYYEAFAGTTNFVSNWVDLSATFYGNIKFKKFLISAEYTPIYTYNYEYMQGYDVKNKHTKINLTYFFD